MLVPVQEGSFLILVQVLGACSVWVDGVPTYWGVAVETWGGMSWTVAGTGCLMEEQMLSEGVRKRHKGHCTLKLSMLLYGHRL